MSRHWKVQDLLKSKEWGPFHALLRKRTTTVDRAYTWLSSRGYAVSRGAVWNYMKASRKASALQMRRQLGGGSDATVRRKLCKQIERMTGAELTAMACFVQAWRQMHGDQEARRPRRQVETSKQQQADGVVLRPARRAIVKRSKALKTE